MARHLERIHKNELEVARALSFSKGSKERRIHLDLLRNKGNHVHNTNVLKAGKGELVPCQRTTKNEDVKNYMHCVNCQGLFRRKALWRHMSRCKLAKKCTTTKPGKSRAQALCAYAQPVSEGVNKKLWKLISDMNQDEVTQTVKSDTCIIKFGEHLYNKMGSDKTKHEYIRQKMREASRLLLHARKAGKLQRIKDFFVPANFNHVIQAVKDTCGFKEDDHVFKVPSLALKLGHSLKKMADLVECEAMIGEEDDVVQNVKKFKHLHSTKWNESVSASALKTLHESKWNRPELLPFTEDVKKMHLHLDANRKDYQSKLASEKTQKNWSDLAKVTLCEVILFNRRRAGEVSKMRLNSYVLRDTSDLHSDVADALSEVEKKLCEHFQRIEIRGKRDRKVPILLTPDMVTSMELLVKNRRACGVTDENLFMFARPEAETYFRGSDCIRKFASECGAKHPKTLSSTKLRKHVSTLSKVLNLKDTEMDQLADFLGHDIRVHRKFYRLPEGTLQLAKISKVLMALEQGRMSEFKGRNLEDITIEPNEKVNLDSDLSESDDQDEAEQQTQTMPCQSPLTSKETVPADRDQSESEDQNRNAEQQRKPCLSSSVSKVTPAQAAAPVQSEALAVGVSGAHGAVARDEIRSARAAPRQSLRLVHLHLHPGAHHHHHHHLHLHCPTISPAQSPSAPHALRSCTDSESARLTPRVQHAHSQSQQGRRGHIHPITTQGPGCAATYNQPITGRRRSYKSHG
ncbi:hypothetical protein MHYP_G00062270 [Metynnis hypsauchen]